MRRRDICLRNRNGNSKDSFKKSVGSSCITLFGAFLCSHYTTTTGNLLKRLLLLEDGNTRQRVQKNWHAVKKLRE